MKSKVFHEFVSDCGKAKVYVENDMQLGVFHDFLMHLKGAMVERMVQVHEDQLKDVSDTKNRDNIP